MSFSEKSLTCDYDIFVIGGGINGCGVARDAIGRGHSVCLVEMDDLASGTSSWSSKLIHGGLRYLEHYHFRLVREALNEREVLLKMAPHIIWPMRFVLPHNKGMRPAWLLRLGLFLYDHIGKRSLLPATRAVNLKDADAGKPLKSVFSKGFEYSDCWVDDARLVILNAKSAADLGARIETRTQFLAAKRTGEFWTITTKDLNTGITRERTAKLIVNAAGPWVDNVIGQAFGNDNTKNVRLVQGSHIVVPKLHDHDRAYIFQNADNRIIFALPFERDYTLIGTTDRDFQGDPKNAKISPEETSYLCEAVSEYFQKTIEPANVVWSFSGVRPLYDDGASAAQEATREYVLRDDGAVNEPCVINIFGGKITTYRKLAEAVMQKVERRLGQGSPAWTAQSHLPGGDFNIEDFDSIVEAVRTNYSFIDRALAWRLVRSYGTQVWRLLDGVHNQEDMGEEFGGSLTAREVEYLMDYEWAQTAQDIIWRRSKLGLKLKKQQIARLDEWMRNRSQSLLRAAK